MTPREATILHLKQIKDQPLKAQLKYILANFWIPIVSILSAMILLCSLVIHWSSQKANVLTLCCIDPISVDADPEGYLNEFALAQGIDTDRCELTVEQMYFNQGTDTDYQYVQLFAAMQMAGDLDVLVADYETVLTYAYRSSFSDLSEILTYDELKDLSPHLLYIDLSLPETADAYPDPTKPEEMTQPVPVAIQLQPQWDFTVACYPHTYEGNAVALFVNGSNASNAEAFLRYILNYKR